VGFTNSFVDFSDYGAEPVNGAARDQQERMLRLMGYEELLHPQNSTTT
jgi:hypothetical protein